MTTIAATFSVASAFKFGCCQAWNLALEQFFDIRQVLHFIRAHQRDRLARRTGTAGATDAVDVIFRCIGQFIVNHKRQLINIEAARGDFGGNQDFHFALFEFIERLGAFKLRTITVDGGGGKAVADQFAGKVIGIDFAACKNQHLLHIAGFNQVCQQRMFARGGNFVSLMCNQLGWCIAARDFDHHRVAHKLIRESLDIF